MKDSLRKKFLVTAMGPITALLLLLLVGINLVNWYQVDRQTDRMLQTVLQHGAMEAPAPPGEGMGPAPQPDWQLVLPPEAQADIRAAARARILSMALLSGGGVVLCWLGMLALVDLLSRRAIEPVAESIRKQREFVTNAGHELKTPLAIIRANTEAMELSQGENRWTRNIKGQTDRLADLTANLLTLARLDEGHSRPPALPVDLSALAEETAQSFRETAALRGILLEEEIPPGLTLRGDRGELTQLLSILLDNAVRYTDPGGRVTTGLKEEGDALVLRVRNGPAHLSGDPEGLFDRFCRGDPARTQKTGGSGIGLSAARAIVTAWGGTIRADREGEDGVVFTVFFPTLPPTS